MWQFFSDHDDAIERKRNEFWDTVQRATQQKFQTLREPDESERYIEKKWASFYLISDYKNELDQAHQQLYKSFSEFCPKLPPPITPETLTLVICFDEARYLCTSSARFEYVRHNPTNLDVDAVKKQSEHIAFSNFRAMRRALRFLSQADPIPRVFGLFTDTTPRLHRFPPRLLGDISLRLIGLPDPGTDQFDPLYVFTSMDAHSKSAPNNYALSDPQKVAQFERLLKFERAGWYSLYKGKSKWSPTLKL